MNLINVKDLIIELKKRNVDLGKGNPYNRLRYFTKIGWIDHMVRKKDSTGVVIGHFPVEVIEQIEYVEELKKQNKSNEEITKLIKIKKNPVLKKESPYTDLKIFISKISITHVLLILIACGSLFELLNYRSRNEKMVINPNLNQAPASLTQITETGFNFVPSGKNTIFINSRKVTKNSVILVNFEGSISPATNYFISEKIDNEGFFVSTNLPVNTDTKFSWAILN